MKTNKPQPADWEKKLERILIYETGKDWGHKPALEKIKELIRAEMKTKNDLIYDNRVNHICGARCKVCGHIFSFKNILKR